MSEVLAIRGLSHAYRLGRKQGVVQALDGVSLQVAEGEIFGLLGPNGAGKTTLFRILIGLLKADSGDYSIFGLDPDADPDAVLRRIGWMPEQFTPYPDLTARATLRFYGSFYDLSRARLQERIEELLDLTGLSEVADRRVGTFSFGMSKRLLLCQALVHQPQLLILDEPSNGLDPIVARALRTTLRKLAGEGLTIIFSSHALIDVETLSDRVGILNRGKLIVEGRIEEIPQRIQSAEERHLHLHILGDPARFIAIAQAVAGVAAVVATSRGLEAVIDLRPETRVRLIRALVEAGAEIHGMHLPGVDLESVFMAIIDQDTADPASTERAGTRLDPTGGQV